MRVYVNIILVEIHINPTLQSVNGKFVQAKDLFLKLKSVNPILSVKERAASVKEAKYYH